MIPDRWYPILEASKLGRRPVGLQRMGERLVLWRDGSGAPVVLPGFCPHRGADLGQGRVQDGELSCPWHGFRFEAGGRCTRMPCEGREAPIPKALHLAPYPTREASGLVWLWWGEARAELPEIPFFDEGRDPRGTAQASYVLPYHYSRMVETNLDIHHTPFVHGNVIPVGERVDGFEASLQGDRIETRGVLRREGKAEGMTFRADLILPGTGLIELTPKLHILVVSTPVDEGHTWLWFRYHSRYTRLPALRRLLSWLSVQSELRVVQRQDWRIFRSMAPGTIDDFPYRFVHADAGIALYRKRRRELLDAAVPRSTGVAAARLAVGT
ncbi:MAG: aromatic ring-hydroxylating dioxygenase subunit alpha [Myxococcota bacterium]